MSNTSENNKEISQESEVFAPCGREGTCTCCVVRHIADAGLDQLSHSRRKAAIDLLSHELTGTSSKMDRLTVPIGRQEATLMQHRRNAEHCPTVRANPVAQNAFKIVDNSASRHLGAEVNGVIRTNG